ncbi:4a-hydroxytetrahydrobiopterin dehydratase [Rhodoferax sp.]|uniref:4a-hydroxytetrahydrobiopterin dehydratase n=1 Tax=Rhodoferax sp. TaxID=50421 RepID=UPI0025EE8436|nr:4a-hydroxytetrahydrobiopterin dehydratase [Rhodoferax sp.]MCM2295230.1 4a-hydroxytetrahydrobiopterin dehydratase [Rhodoferax sp.]
MSLTQSKRALTATEVVTRLAKLEGWNLDGDGAAVVIQKTFCFADYAQTMLFVNAVAWVAQARHHHPELIVQFDRCLVRYCTHDVAGLSQADFDCAAAVDALPDAVNTSHP